MIGCLPCRKYGFNHISWGAGGSSGQRPARSTRTSPRHDGAIAGTFGELITVAVHRQSALSRSVWIVLAIALVASAGLWAFHSYERLGDQLSALAGITLGDTRGEIRYKRGVPPVVYGGQDDGQGSATRAYYTDRETDPGNALPEGADINGYRTWSYDSGPSPSAHLNITFDTATGRTSRIDCIDQLDPPTSFCPPLVGIGISESRSR